MCICLCMCVYIYIYSYIYIYIYIHTYTYVRRETDGLYKFALSRRNETPSRAESVSPSRDAHIWYSYFRHCISWYNYHSIVY